jgi:alpha-L-fucosidase
MKTPRLARPAAALAAALLAVSGPAPAQTSALPQSASPQSASVDPHATETRAQRDARMKWWREAKFGMFIHWGLYAVPAGRYDGKPVGGIGEWIMNTGKIPVAEYAAYAKQFDPEQFNADQWVSVAKAAGMKYIVLTAKHHEGFAMFPTKVDDYNIAARTRFQRDPIGEMAAACKKQGIKFGVYYSQAQDWRHPGGAAYGGHWDPAAQDGDLHAYVQKVAAPQVAELLTRYHPAVLWWDTPVDMSQEDIRALTAAFAQDPGLIANNRLGNGVPGDTETPEQNIPATGFKNRDWETCMTINDTWGYKKDDTHFKSVETLLHNLIDIASKGGNYLLNVGPTAQGIIPAPEVERLRAVGAWMKRNGEAVYATSASPFKRLPWGRCTQKADGANTTLYLHVFDWPADGKLRVPGLRNAVRSAYLLDGRRSVPAALDADGVTVTVPTTAPDPISATVVLKIVGKPDVVPTSIGQDAAGVLTLAAVDAVTHGAVSYESGGGKDNLGFWLNPADWAEWPVTITRPGKFTVTAQIAAQGSGSFWVEARNAKTRFIGVAANGLPLATLVGKAPNTGDYTKFQTVDLGMLAITEAGPVSISVHPVTQGWQPMNLKSLTLTPGR